MTNKNNSVFVIVPYKWYGSFVFDDPERGLLREPFVLGMSEMIERMLEERGINGDEGFRMYFGAIKPPDKGVYHLKLMFKDAGGGWYRNVETRMCGWLCPAMFAYFDALPQDLYCLAVGISDEVAEYVRTKNLDLAIKLGLVKLHYPDNIDSVMP